MLIASLLTAIRTLPATCPLLARSSQELNGATYSMLEKKKDKKKKLGMIEVKKKGKLKKLKEVKGGNGFGEGTQGE